MSERDVLIVRGWARRTAAPDHAVLRLTVASSAPTAAAVERGVADAAAALDAALDEHGGAIGTRVATGVQVRPNMYWDQTSGRQVRDGFVGDRTMRVRIDDPLRTGDVLRAVYDSGIDVEVSGPSWGLGDEHPVHAEVRAAAAADARARAAAYAAGLGVGVGSVAVVAEPGLRAPGGGGWAPVQPAMAKMAMAAEADGGGDPIGLPAEVEVTASVEVAFHLER